jgi:hypothetical protein
LSTAIGLSPVAAIGSPRCEIGAQDVADLRSRNGADLTASRVGLCALSILALLSSSHASARPTAQRYLDAGAAGNAIEICHLLSPSARRELRET